MNKDKNITTRLESLENGFRALEEVLKDSQDLRARQLLFRAQNVLYKEMAKLDPQKYGYKAK